ncbi:unnamed protein product, partial [Heterosigma akashiwo]
MIFLDFETECTSGEQLVNFASACYNDEFQNMMNFNTVEETCEWLFQKQHRGYIVVCHYGQGFDFNFIMRYAIEHLPNIKTNKPDIIMNGTKIMYAKFKGINLKLVDSINFFGCALEKLPSMFGFQDEVKKGFFPHRFNIPFNQHKVFDRYPGVEFYDIDSMKPEKRQRFLEWYESVKDNQFDFDAEMKAYCDDDVKVLARACMTFKNIFMNQIVDGGTINPFNFPTIASACMTVYRSKFMPSDTIGLLKNMGADNYSVRSIQWLNEIAERDGIEIQHAENGGEYSVTSKLKVDGFCAETNTVFQFHGCFYHGHPKCMDGDRYNPLRGVKMIDLHKKTIEVSDYIRSQGYNLVEMYDCEFEAQSELPLKKKNLDFRDAYFGGRTSATHLYYKASGDEKIYYIDIVSLYPSVMHHAILPVGHPVYIRDREKFLGLEELFGFQTCRVLPNNTLYHGVLPWKEPETGKLLFPLHEIEGTWTSVELIKAVEKGYVVLEIYQQCHFQERSDELFTEYVDTFFEIKTRAAAEGNSGLKAVAKCCLNSLYGKFAQNNASKRKNKLCFTAKEFNDLYYSDSIRNCDNVFVSMLTEEATMLQYHEKAMMINEGLINVPIAAFITAYARLELYKAMDILGDKVLYHDTDSIIYRSPDGSKLIAQGKNLGEWEPELKESDWITEFVSSGPKSYAYKTKSGKDDCCKVKGFQLNYANQLKINFDTMKEYVFDGVLKGEAELSSEKPSIEMYKEQFKVMVRENPSVKTMKFNFDKRVIDE